MRRFYGKTFSLKDLPPGKYDMIGTVKIHGTHAGMFFDGATVSAQSRHRVLSAEADNLGTFFHVMKHVDFYTKLAREIGKGEAVYIWGEYAGEGIQKGVGVSLLSRRMFIYGAEHESGEEVDPETVRAAVVRLRTNELVYHLHEFETVPLTIDTREGADNEAAVALINEVTARFEAQCPVSKAFEVEGVGEGLVFAGNNCRFKSKGAKHQAYRRPVAVKASKETVASFVENAVTPSRVEQGKQLHGTGMCKALLDWIIHDIFTEEADVVEALPKKDVCKAIAARLRAMCK